MKGSEALLKAAVEAALPELGEVELARLAADCLEEREIFAEVIAVHGDHLICSSRFGDVLVPSKLLTFPADAGCLLRAGGLPASPRDEEALESFFPERCEVVRVHAVQEALLFPERGENGAGGAQATAHRVRLADDRGPGRGVAREDAPQNGR